VVEAYGVEMSKTNKINQMRTILIIIFLSTITGNVISDITMPVDNFYPGWSKTDSLRRFTKENLYSHINGGAVLFEEFGFVELLVQRYGNQKKELKIEVYNMEGPESALGVYLMKKGKENPNPEIDCRNTCNPYQYIMAKGDYFILVFNSIGDTTLLPAMTKLSQELLKQIVDKNIAIIDILPNKEIIPNTMKIIRGQYSLQSVYNFGSGDILTLGGKIFGVSATYFDKKNQVYTVILIPYPNADTCLRAFQNLIANLAADISIIKQAERKLNFIDLESKYGTVKISGNMMKLVVNLKVVESN
jgi:hypothetical protein